MDATEQRQALAAIARQVAVCHDCALYKGTTNPVPGEGSASAQIMFIGEGPGFYEDQQGRPFVGASGKFLDELLASINLDRKKVFITNVVKHRPPNNRDPQADEIAACKKYLDEQVDLIAPKVIVTLGRHSMQRYFPGESISRVHGQPRRKDGVIVVPMYHPAAALHQQTLRKVIEADFAKLPEFLEKTLNNAAPAREEVPEQLRKSAPRGEAETSANAESTPADAQQMRLL
ncbi:MAG TPA: uracil-DNA glycosylase [Dehalococcoidia bacterium]|nr:uracil-DNA glycosylase [Dehalococcoidia bacterium]